MAKSTSISEIQIILDGKQAERTINVLTEKLESLRAEKNAINAKPMITKEENVRLREVTAEIKKTEGALRKVRSQAFDVGAVLRDVTKATEGDLVRAIRILNNQTKKLDRTTQEYAENKKRLAVLRAELDKTGYAAGRTSTSFGKFGSVIGKLAKGFVLLELINQLRQFVIASFEINRQLSDQIASIEKTTGIAGDDLANLVNEIKRIDTRSSVEQLNKLASAAGRLGLKSQEDVLGFVRAGDMINTALGEELGEEAITNLTKLNQLLGVTKELGVEQSLLATGSAINELGQSSTAKEGYLVDFAGRLGGVAAQSKLTMQELLALGAVLDQNKVTAEVGATAMSSFLTTLLSKTSQVAKALSIPLKELQDALDVSTWQGIMLVFDRMSEMGGLASLAPLMKDLGGEGERMVSVFSALAGSTDKLTEAVNTSREAFSEATSVIKEADKVNSTLAANWDKLWSNYSKRIMSSNTINFLNKIVGALADITKLEQTLNTQFSDQIKTVYKLQSELTPLIAKYNQIAESTVNDKQDQLKEIAGKIASIVPESAAAWDKYGDVLQANTTIAQNFIDTQIELMKQYNQEMINEVDKQLNSLEAQNKLYQGYINQIQKNKEKSGKEGFLKKGQRTYTYVSDPTEINSIKKEANEIERQIDNLREKRAQLSGDYYKEYIEQQKTAAEEAERERTKAEEKAKEIADQERKAKEEREAKEQREQAEKDRAERIRKEQAAIDLWLQQKKNALSEARLAEQDANSESYISQEEYNRAVEGLEMEAMRKRLAILGLEPNEVAKIEGQILDIRQKIIDETIKAQQKAKEEVDKLLLDADPIKKENIEYEERLKKIDVFGKQREELTKEQLSALELLEKQHTDNLIEIEIRLQKRREKLAEEKFQKEYKEELEAKKTSLQDKEDVTDIRSKLGFDTETETYKRQQETSKKKIELMYYELKKRQEIGATEIDILNDIENERSKMTDRAVNEFVRVTNVAEQYGTQIGDAFGQMFTSVEDGWKALGDVAIDIIFDLVEKHITAKLVELAATGVSAIGKASAESFATPDSVLTFGASGAARMAIMTGLISGVIATAKVGLKSLLNKKKEGATTTSGSTGQRVVKTSGFRVGGFTGEGPTYEVAGVVHRGEYIVPKWQMYDPISFNMVRALEAIRQTRSHENILSVHRNGYAEGGLVQTPMQTISMQPNDPQMVALMQDMYALLSSLRRDGVKTVFSVSRLEQTQARLNASRLRGSLKK